MAHVILVSAVALVALIATGTVDVRVDWNRGAASALDLFGESEETTPEAAEPFWTEGTGGVLPDAPTALPSLADLAERISPAVVNINTSKTVLHRGFQNPFEEFFGIPRQPFGGPREFKAESLGSGFVISADGFILTNNHVVGDVDSITVTFSDGKEIEAEIVGRDPKTDVALIRVQAEEPLHALPLGDSDAVRPGDWVVAIGNPFGFEHTVTAGIVSGKHRIIGQGSYDDFIQTDAAINPGNSGGPLINLAGEAIGINTAINPRANTMGFAVPVNMAKSILPQLRAKGHAVRGWLGVGIQKITPELVETLELEDDKGALVSQVFDDSPAAKAGFERSDVIVEFDGK
ncbi:MAG: trypsin-like peptidase domain-containing protein, partial [Deltaproteobacteria bacterium]